MQTFRTTIALVLGLSAALLFALASMQAQDQAEAPAREVAPDVPDAIAVPPSLEPVLSLHAKGSQIYTCQAGADGKFAWTLKGPEAELSNRDKRVIGHHLADPTSKLPTWRLNDGSQVSGKAAAHVDSPDSDSIPWLLVNVVSNGGNGRLARVTAIQRVHTHGGKAGSDVCDESHKDAETKSSYIADYFFFAPRK
jgi:hypothetical protein